MDELVDFMLKPVPDHPDVFAFVHDFWIEGKALDNGEKAPTVIEDENGDLIIEGWAASFDGLDRHGENFVEGAFDRGVKAFLDGTRSLCFHHQNDKGIGEVLDLDPSSKGLWMKARVDFQPESSPLRYIYNAVKKGSYKGLSVGGFFKRALVNGRKMIADMDFTEISITPVAVHPKTKFAVVAGKALSNDLNIPEGVEVEVPEDELRANDFDRLQFALNELERVLEELRKRNTGEKPEPVSEELGLVG